MPAPLLRRGAPLSEDGTAAEPRGSSWFPSLSLVYVRLAPGGIYLFYALGRDPVRLCSAAEPALALALGSSSLGSAVPPRHSHLWGLLCFVSEYVPSSGTRCSRLI